MSKPPRHPNKPTAIVHAESGMPDLSNHSLLLVLCDVLLKQISKAV